MLQVLLWTLAMQDVLHTTCGELKHWYNHAGNHSCCSRKGGHESDSVDVSLPRVDHAIITFQDVSLEVVNGTILGFPFPSIVIIDSYNDQRWDSTDTTVWDSTNTTAIVTVPNINLVNRYLERLSTLRPSAFATGNSGRAPSIDVHLTTVLNTHGIITFEPLNRIAFFWH